VHSHDSNPKTDVGAILKISNGGKMISKKINPGNLYSTYCKPKLADLIHCLKLDQRYVKAQGCELFTENGKKVIDFIGGFGATLLGHNNPVLKETLISALDADIAVQVQVSTRHESARLAEKINSLIPGETGYFACFTNSGTESVEAALKHVYKVQFDKIRRDYERMCRILNDFYYQVEKAYPNIEVPGNKKLIDFRDDIDEYNLAQFESFSDHPTVIGFKGSFHGKSTSPLKMTFNKSYREGYQGLSAINSIFIDLTDCARIPEIIDEHKCTFYYPVLMNEKVELRPYSVTKVIAMIFEPILGEGGVIPLPPTTVDYLADHYDQLRIPYIVDEIQSGCGRTGSFLHYEQTSLCKIEPDYIVMSKALGGGLVKIGVTLIRKDIYDHDFGILHTSTFGEDDLSAVVAMKVINMLQENDQLLMREITRKGDYLMKRLNELKLEFPTIIKDVRGKGLMVGMEFTDLQDRAPFFRLSGKQGTLSLLIASYLLEYYQVRLLAPLTTMLKGNPGKKRKSIIRMQPPALITTEQMDLLIEGLREVLHIVDSNNEYCLIGHLFGESLPKEYRQSPYQYTNDWPTSDKTCHIDSRTGFIIHPTTLENLITYFFPSLRDYNADKNNLKAWWSRICRFLEPVHVKSDYISSNDYVIENNLVLVPYLPEYLTCDKPAYLTQEIRDKIQDAVIIAKELGDENIPLTMVGLGAYTSIVTNNGLTINDYEMCITTGNAFTVGLTIRGIYKAAESRNIDLSQSTVSVVGANGNIGQTIARILAPRVGKMVLIGSSKRDSLYRLQNTKKLCIEEVSAMGTHRILPSDFIDITTNYDRLPESDVVVLATNSSDMRLIHPNMMRGGAIICCVSTPTNLHEDFSKQTEILAFDAGLARLPEDSEIRFVGMPSEGMSYGCLAETLLLGFDGYNHSFSKGGLDPSQIYQVIEWADMHGFSLGALYLDGKTVMNDSLTVA